VAFFKLIAACNISDFIVHTHDEGSVAKEQNSRCTIALLKMYSAIINGWTEKRPNASIFQGNKTVEPVVLRASRS
jgi:hypothetical protein